MFAWLRPNDLVWNYWVNNYLLGRTPPAFDILAWNADATNLPAGLHADFLTISSDNRLARPGGLEVLGTKVDLAAVGCDAYVVGGLTDHIIPWQSCYRSLDLLGGRTEFVLCASGHIQTLVCPRGSAKSRYLTSGDQSLRRSRPTPTDPTTRRSGGPAPRSTRAPGGTTGRPGCRDDPASSSPHPSTSARPPTRPATTPPAATCSTERCPTNLDRRWRKGGRDDGSAGVACGYRSRAGRARAWRRCC